MLGVVTLRETGYPNITPCVIITHLRSTNLVYQENGGLSGNSQARCTLRVLGVLELFCVAGVGVVSNKMVRPCWSLGSNSQSYGCENVKYTLENAPTFDAELSLRM